MMRDEDEEDPFGHGGSLDPDPADTRPAHTSVNGDADTANTDCATTTTTKRSRHSHDTDADETRALVNARQVMAVTARPSANERIEAVRDRLRAKLAARQTAASESESCVDKDTTDRVDHADDAADSTEYKSEQARSPAKRYKVTTGDNADARYEDYRHVDDHLMDRPKDAERHRKSCYRLLCRRPGDSKQRRQRPHYCRCRRRGRRGGLPSTPRLQRKGQRDSTPR